MAHFAKVEDGIVTQVIVADQDFIDNHCTGTWIQTSYNNNMRKQFAGVGYTYDDVNDVFVSPPPYPSWSLDENHDWQPPSPKPDDENTYTCNEEIQSWDIVESE